ncbi:MAG: flagellar assembly protein FliX [Pseudomonadota bacterium]
MYVNQIRSTGVSAGSAKKRTAGATGFDAHLHSGGSIQSNAGAGAAGQVLGMDALVALQSVSDQGERRKRQIDRSKGLLDELERLKADLLAGRVDRRRLERIGQLVAQHAAVDDPHLAELVAQIDLRAQVELAKLGI